MTDEEKSGFLRLTAKQKAFAERLGEKYPLLHRMYLGALGVLQQAENPDRFSLAAHGIRELMEKIPEYLDVDMPAHREDLRCKVDELEKKWLKASAASECPKGGTWEGLIDPPLRAALREVGLFFDWRKNHMPRRRQEVGNVLKELDGTKKSLPEPLKNLNVEYWQEIQGFFLKVSHHRKTTDEQEFERWMDSFETFLLDRLSPRTFADIDEIDALIHQGKGNADA